VFESAERPGGHTWTDRNCPGFERLLERLGVATQPSAMSFSVSDGSGEFEYNGASPNGLFARWASHSTRCASTSGWTGDRSPPWPPR
jgi:predicted NAD/FAD-binding protein